ncbi:polysaccharide biosynthesis/export family protein [Roseovarius sp. SCSIO 43702]|uniref:polysaccharide biosynthesis/export family protein n=1 Tax=Roseovarius sp. SCSIO 43702 TaxID=2823043 RepID=UPI001C72E8A1|nr:polysaccharide biosynthesis/export family protein [Roseovarius sp. SCSIO 43702]QYX57394.1 polysaccharide biosynthesis/export family protein [Roseovarius sp. SCSIO 43702]
MNKTIFAALAFLLSGCGVAYISPDVRANDPNVQVIEMDAASVAAANRSSYSPKTVPAAFFRNAGGAGSLRGVGATPDPAVDRQVKPSSLPMRLPPDAPQQPYTIGVGDVILLSTPQTGSTVEELSGLLKAQNSRQGYTVQDDGAIAVPDVGRINLAGLTLEEAEARVFEKLIENQIDPSFSIEIAEFNSKRVTVGGAVGNPAVVPITLTSLTLEEALAAAGGIATDDEDYASIRLYRDGTLYEVPLTEYFKRPQVQKTRLAAGDSIFVDTEFDLDNAQAYFTEQITLAQFRQDARVQALNEMNSAMNLRRAALEEERTNFATRLELDAVDRDYVYLAGEVNKPSRFALPFGQTASLADALFSEGGSSNREANPTQVYVLRGEEGSSRITAYNLNYRQAANLILATKFELRPNDVIFIAEQPITRWNRVVQQLVPSLITSGAAIANN